MQVDTYHIKIKTGNRYHGYKYYGVNLVVKKIKNTGEALYDHLVINEENKSISKSLLKNGWEQKTGTNADDSITGKEYIKEQSSFPYSQRRSIKFPQWLEGGSHFPQPFGIDKPYHSNRDKSIKKSLNKKILPDLTISQNPLPDLTAIAELPDLTQPSDYPSNTSEPKPEKCQERWSYSKSLDEACECGELTLCLMRPNGKNLLYH